jgi:hypothetical protein
MEDFDVLKREATKLERHLEDRVAKYQQVSLPVPVPVLVPVGFEHVRHWHSSIPLRSTLLAAFL